MRRLRDEARVLLAKGTHPRTFRQQQRQLALLAEAHTFKAVFEAWVQHRRLVLKEGRQSTLSQILRIFNKDVLPFLGKQSIYAIRRLDLLEVLARIERRRAFTTAEKVRTWLNQLFRYALVKIPGLDQNWASDLDVVAQLASPDPVLRLIRRRYAK